MKCIAPRYIRGETSSPLLVTCGKCIACRIAKRREWSLRMLHELSYWEDTIFITLTYDDAHLPGADIHGGSLVKADLQKFFKRLRKDIEPKKIKYFACGEYGSETFRPHYHAIIYGLSPRDADIIKDNWHYCQWSKLDDAKSFGVVQYQSISYVAGYIHTKYGGELEETEYTQYGKETPFRLSSNGLGKQYADDNVQQFENLGYITHQGIKHSIPRYYLKRSGIKPNKQQALESERLLNEQITGLIKTNEELYLSGLNNELIKKVEKIQISREQTELNLKAQISLKSTKL